MDRFAESAGVCCGARDSAAMSGVIPFKCSADFSSIVGFGSVADEVRSGPIVSEGACAEIVWKSNRENKTDSEKPKEVLRAIASESPDNAPNVCEPLPDIQSQLETGSWRGFATGSRMAEDTTRRTAI